MRNEPEMGMGKVKVAIATKGSAGLWDEVSEFFAKAKTFTLATVEGNKVHIEVLQNPGATLPYGRGRTAVQLLRNRGVDVVVTSEFGPRASALLEQSKIDRVIVRAGTRVGDVIRDKLYKKRKRVRRVKHKLVGNQEVTLGDPWANITTTRPSSST